MRKSLVAWSIACTMLAAGTVARAEMAAPVAPTPYGETINIEQAKKIAAAAAAEAKKNNWFMAISVVGPAGDLVYFEKMDNTQYASVTISQHKARAAATFRRPTKAFEENLAKGSGIHLPADARRDDRIAGRRPADRRRQAHRRDRRQRRHRPAGLADLHRRRDREK